MDHKTKSMIENLRQNQGALKAILSSSDGQMLMRQLTSQDGGAALQRAARSASQGDTAELSRMIGKLMESREGAELIRRINQSAQK
ncbi:MAG: hypothetical protein Q3X94_10965 [Oscillospiraceae bacterium]|nr:hypothetical protein [Oscillospiraceae bacterium]